MVEISMPTLAFCTVFLRNSVKSGELAQGPGGWFLGPTPLPVGTPGAELSPCLHHVPVLRMLSAEGQNVV